MAALPYIVGAFMITPLVVWFGLWLFAFPGTKSGFDVPLMASLLAVSIPLVLTFFIANLAFISNSMARRDEFGLPAWRPARLMLRAQPVLAGLTGVATAAYLLLIGEPAGVAAIPLGLSLVIAYACHRTIRQGGTGRPQAGDDAPADGLAAPRPARHPSWRHGAAKVGLWLVYAIPVLGWLLRDAVRGDASARAFFAFNLATVWAIAAGLVGIELVFVTALILTPVVFVTFIAMTRG